MGEIGSQNASFRDGECRDKLKPTRASVYSQCMPYMYKRVLLHLYSHGEALTFEPLLMREEESVLRDFGILAIATVTQAIFLTLVPKVEALTSLSLKVR